MPHSDSGTDEDDVLLVFRRLKEGGQDAEEKVRGWRVVYTKVDEAKLASRHRKGDITAWAPDGKRCRTEAALKSHISFLAPEQRDGARDSNEREREEASSALRQDECAASAFDVEHQAASSLLHVQTTLPRPRFAARNSSLSDEEYVVFLRSKYGMEDGEADQLVDRMQRLHPPPRLRVDREGNESGEQGRERVVILHATHVEDATHPSHCECLDAEECVEAGHDLLLPSSLTQPPPPTLSDRGPRVRSLVGKDALQAMKTYALGNEMKELHRRILMHPKNPASLQALLLEESKLPVGILVQTTGRRRQILLVHVSERERGLGSLVGTHALSILPPGGSLSVDSPACTAKAAVRLWLSLGFMGDESLLTCHLADESAYVGGRSVRLSFTYTKDETEEGKKARCAYLKRVMLVHPAMSSACTRGMRVLQ